MTRSGKEQYLPRITVYTKPGCVQCRATMRALQRAGLDHVTIRHLDRPAGDFVMSLGYLQAPVVVCGPRHWSGFRPDRIANLAAGAA
jgi:glutaredoxin-like protein NrdH